MKVTELSNKAGRFITQNSNIPLCESEVLIRIIEIDNWLRVVIEVGENATHENLRKANTLALEWRDRLLDYQGPWFGGGTNYFKESLFRKHERGKSYSEIAKMLNDRILEYIINDLENKRRIEKIQQELGEKATFIDFLKYQKDNNCMDLFFFSFEHAKDILREFSMKEMKIEGFITEIISCLQNGETPALDEFLISKRMVVDLIINWKKGKKHISIEDKYY